MASIRENAFESVAGIIERKQLKMIENEMKMKTNFICLTRHKVEIGERSTKDTKEIKTNYLQYLMKKLLKRDVRALGGWRQFLRRVVQWVRRRNNS